ncbi:MAG: hypothetical protein DMH00_08935 [Acidobacteria bacterium]|nr:MAG: hypothetical protein DMH00_08935 [Acidobacteriota bacterium]
MKKLLGVFLCLVPLAVHAQQTYTNEDVKNFTVARAYTNQDLKKMKPLPVVGVAAPRAADPDPVAEDAGPYQLRMDLLKEQRCILQAELDWRNAEIEKAYSFLDKGPGGYPWPGYLSKSKGALQYLRMQLAVVDARIDFLKDEARRADVIVDSR